MENIHKIIEITGLKKLDSIKHLEHIESTHRIKPSILGLGVSLIVLILIVFSVTHSLVMFIVGFLVPAYFTLRGVSSKGGIEDVKYLMYWICYSITEVITPLITLFLPQTYWVILRIIATVLLLHPSVEGARAIYYQVVEPLVEKVDNQIDKLLSEERSPRGSLYS